MIKKVIVAVIVIAILIIGLSLFYNKKVEIVVLYPATGEASSYGIDIRNSLELTKLAHKQSKHKHNKIKFIFENTQCDKNLAFDITKKYLKKNVKIFLTGCSSETLGSWEASKDTDAIVFSPISSSSQLSNLEPAVFRTLPNNTRAARILAERIANNEKNIIIVSEDTDYAKTFGIDLARFLNGFGVNIRNHIIYDSKSTVSGTVAIIKKSYNTAVVINTQGEPLTGTLINTLGKTGFKNQIYSTFAMDGKIARAKSGKYGRGVVYISEAKLPINENIKEFLLNYINIYGNPTFPIYSVLAFDSFLILDEAISKVKGRWSRLSTEKIREYISGNTIKGLIGEYTFERDGVAKNPNIYPFINIVSSKRVN